MLFKPIVERRFGMFSHLESSKSGPAPRESFPPQPGADQGKSWKTLVPGPWSLSIPVATQRWHPIKQVRDIFFATAQAL